MTGTTEVTELGFYVQLDTK